MLVIDMFFVKKIKDMQFLVKKIVSYKLIYFHTGSSHNNLDQKLY